jgi:hypothetical protein
LRLDAVGGERGDDEVGGLGDFAREFFDGVHDGREEWAVLERGCDEVNVFSSERPRAVDAMKKQHAAYQTSDSDELWARIAIGLLALSLAAQLVRDALYYFG